MGALFTALALITGSLWGRPMWGAYWVWDGRLTSFLLLLFLYLGYIALWNAIEDEIRAARAAAILALVGVVNLPIIEFSVDWWTTLHQGESIFRAGGPLDRRRVPVAAVHDGARLYRAVLHALDGPHPHRDPRAPRPHADAGGLCMSGVSSPWADMRPSSGRPMASARSGSVAALVLTLSRLYARAKAQLAALENDAREAADLHRAGVCLRGACGCSVLSVSHRAAAGRIAVGADRQARARARAAPLDAERKASRRPICAKGHVTVVNVFASWCVPCREEAPRTAALVASLKGVALYGMV